MTLPNDAEFKNAPAVTTEMCMKICNGNEEAAKEVATAIMTIHNHVRMLCLSMESNGHVAHYLAAHPSFTQMVAENYLEVLVKDGHLDDI